jgi:hypothetical protein
MRLATAGIIALRLDDRSLAEAYEAHDAKRKRKKDGSFTAAEKRTTHVVRRSQGGETYAHTIWIVTDMGGAPTTALLPEEH